MLEDVFLIRALSRITSYINNLHPISNKPLYESIEKILAKAIVMWNHTLDPLRDDRFRAPARIPFHGPEYGNPEDVPPEVRPARDPGEDDFWYNQRLTEMTLIIPDVGEFSEPPKTQLLNLREEFGERGLQVIVKLANIHLTPEKPQYGGGSWHVEGQLVSAIISFIVAKAHSICPERTHLCNCVILLRFVQHYGKSACLPTAIL